ncbi:hypothetical protein [Engelhardtia mirabilis]
MSTRTHGTDRRWLWLLALGLALHLPGLWTGYFSDDFTHLWVLEGHRFGSTLEPWSLYDFGSAEDFRSSTQDLGGVPWWVADDWKVRFFRPVASVVLWFEHVVGGGSPLGHALGGLALWGALLAAIRRLALRWGFKPWAAGAALLIFACSESTHLPVSWAANHNSLLEALFGVLALTAVARARPSARDVLLATGLAMLATASKESGAIFLVLVAVRCAFVAGAPRRRAALPVAAIGAFLALWLLGGYGSTSLFYPMPWEHLGEVRMRGILLGLFGLGGLVGPASLDLMVFHSSLLDPQTPLGALLLLALIGLSILALHVATSRLRATPSGGLLVGWLGLSILSQVCAPTSDRLLFVPAIAFALLAARWVEVSIEQRRGRATVAIVATLMVPVSGLSLVGRQLALADAAAEARELIDEIVHVAPEGGDVVLLNLPNALAGLSLGPAVRLAGGHGDLRPWPLQFGRGGATVERRSVDTYRITRNDGAFLGNPLERVFSTFGHAPDFEASTEHRVGPLSVVPGGRGAPEQRPSRDDPRTFIELSVDHSDLARPLVLAAWVDGHLEAFDLPPVGGSFQFPDAHSRAPLAP